MDHRATDGAENYRVPYSSEEQWSGNTDLIVCPIDFDGELTSQFEHEVREPAKFFGSEISSSTVVFVIDQPCTTEIFAQVNQELGDAIDHLQPQQHFSVIFFGSDDYRVWKFSERHPFVCAGPTNQKRSKLWISDRNRLRTNLPIHCRLFT